MAKSSFAVALLCLVALGAGCTTVSSEITGRSQDSVENESEKVELSLSGSIEWTQKQAKKQGPGVDFRKNIYLSKNQTAELSSSSSENSKTTEDPDPLNDEDLFEDGQISIEVTPVDFNSDSVALQFQVIKMTASGERQILNAPQVVAPYGEATELSEINPGLDADFSRLRISVVPKSPSDPSSN